MTRRDARRGGAHTRPADARPNLWAVFLGTTTAAFTVIALLIVYPPLGLSILAVALTWWNWTEGS